MKRNPIKTLRNKLDRVFSEWIRRRDANDDGMGPCITCGRWAKLQCGHFIKRQHQAVRWNPWNAAGQCAYCNHRLHGNEGEFYVALVSVYGQHKVDELMRLKQTTVRYRKADYLEMIERFSQSLTGGAT